MNLTDAQARMFVENILTTARRKASFYSEQSLTAMRDELAGGKPGYFARHWARYCDRKAAHYFTVVNNAEEILSRPQVLKD